LFLAAGGGLSPQLLFQPDAWFKSLIATCEVLLIDMAPNEASINNQPSAITC
jgi:hypothetical protein